MSTSDLDKSEISNGICIDRETQKIFGHVISTIVFEQLSMGCSGFTNSPVMSTIDSLFRLPMNLIIGLLTLTSSTKKATCNVSDPCRKTINAPLPFVRIECTRPLKVAVFPTKLSSNSWIFFHAVSVILCDWTISASP